MTQTQTSVLETNQKPPTHLRVDVGGESASCPICGGFHTVDRVGHICGQGTPPCPGILVENR